MIPELRTKLMKSADHQDVGRFSYGCPKVLRFPSGGRLIVGSFCSIADEVTILLGGEHDGSAVSTYPFNALFDQDGLPMHEATRGNVTLGNDVWVGYGALILSGVSIGDGAVIGAASVVTRDVPAYAVVAGNPAVFHRWRFDEETRERVQASRWWDWPLEELRARADEIMGAAQHFREGVAV